MKRLAFIIFFLVSQIALAQNKADQDKADKAFAEKDYVTAAYYYDKALDNGTNTSQGTVPYFSARKNQNQDEQVVSYITYRLAESHRLYLNLIQAQQWYKIVVENYAADHPLARYWYAVCLRSNNHIDEAITQLQTFIKNNKDNKEYGGLANRELNNCLFAKEQGKRTILSTVDKMTTFNGDAGDYAMSVNVDKYWFTSSRTIGSSPKHTNHIYTSELANSAKKTKVDIAIPAKTELQYGPASLNASGKTMYLTIWYKDIDKTVSAIYVSHLTGQKWSVPTKLNTYVNVDGYNSQQPFITADGKQLYFASNRPGGYGGTDIWVSDLTTDGIPVNAANLGKTINTADDEQAPYYSDAGHKLVYSSKGFVGMGNFDLFESTDANAGTWTTPQNLGAPFNSTKDDLYYSPDPKDTSAVYISSDRQSECCLNLFKVKVVKPKAPVPPPAPTAVLTGIVIDCATSKPLQNVSINLMDSVSKQIVNFTTGANGKYNFTLTYKHVYTIRIEKKDYFAKVLPVPAMSITKIDTLFSPVICQQSYELNKPIVINNILYSFDSSELNAQSQSVLEGLVTILNDNPKIKVELGSHTDGLGSDATNNRLSQDRAQECVNYIILKGIAPDRIIAKGYGKNVPIAPNTLPDGKDNPAGRKLNRRTEFTVLSNQ